jgi:hypothetical protein
MRLIHFLMITMLLITPVTNSLAGIAESKGMASIVYKGWGEPKSEESEDALRKAKISAVERFIADSGTAKAQNYERVKSEITENIDKYIIDYITLSEKKDKESKRYTIVIRATVNVSRLESTLQLNSAVANSAEEDRSYITFVFVAREQKSAKSYDAREYTRTDKTSSKEGKEYESAGRSGVEYGGEVSTSESETTGGSITRKSDTIEYDVSSADGANIAMSKVLTEAGFEVVEAEYLVEETGGLMNVDAFQRDYQYGDDISGDTRRNAIKGLRKVDVPYLAVGTLDVGMKDIDSATGLTRVFVTVTGKVVSLKKRFPKTVAAVGPVQYSGLGRDQTVARNNALMLAAESAGQTLTQQLNSKGIR